VTKRNDGTIQPDMRIVEEGLSVTLHAELTEGHSAVEIAARLDLSDTRGVQTYSTKISGQDVTVQVPSVSHTRVHTTTVLGDDQTLLLCIPPTFDQKHYAWVLLTPRVIDVGELGLVGTRR
jgi:hypothetical protein